MRISIKGFIAPKKSELFNDCADRYAYDQFQNKFAISDGVSKSFFPKIWADVLVNKWVNEVWNSDDEFITDCQSQWLNQVTAIVNKPEAKWFTKNAFNRREPGLATFVGLEFHKKKKDWHWRAYALGDSFMFFVPKKSKKPSKDYIVLSSKQDPIIFDNYPDYLSSIGDKHKGVKVPKEGLLEPGTFFLMTDALAEWFWNDHKNAIGEISLWQNQTDFERFVNEERYNEKLGNDDSAFLSIEIADDKKDQLTYVTEDVSNINELVKIQQKEIEVEEKTKEEEISIRKENSISETSLEPKVMIEQEISIETELSEDEEIEKPKKGIFKKGKELFFGKKENEQSLKSEELETHEKTEVLKENQNDKEPLTQDEENNSEIEKSENAENNQSQLSEPKIKEYTESNDNTSNASTQNITDKF